MTTSTTRTTLTAAATAALAAGLGWVAIGLESIVRPDPQDYRTVLWVLPFACTTVAVALLHRLQRDTAGRLERVGVALHVWLSPVIAVGDLLILGDGREWAGGVAAAIWTAGLVCFGIGTARAGHFPRWVGLAIAGSEPLTVLAAAALSPLVPLQPEGSYTGVVMHGVVWLLVAATVRRETAFEPARPALATP